MAAVMKTWGAAAGLLVDVLPTLAGADLGIPGLTPFVTANAGFYRVDTDLVVPQLSPRDWTLRIDGMVERELEISFGQLLRMPLTEADGAGPGLRRVGLVQRRVVVQPEITGEDHDRSVHLR
jgi:hypothetical protein